MKDHTELLALRDDIDFFRLGDNRPERCSMAKASVFPLSQEEFVRQQLSRLRSEKLPNARIVKLIIIEEPYPAQ